MYKGMNSLNFTNLLLKAYFGHETQTNNSLRN